MRQQCCVSLASGAGPLSKMSNKCCFINMVLPHTPLTSDIHTQSITCYLL